MQTEDYTERRCLYCDRPVKMNDEELGYNCLFYCTHCGEERDESETYHWSELDEKERTN